MSARESCLDCGRKHLAQAIILLEESELGYPLHFWLCIGHLAEASSELLNDYPELAHTIRNHRLKMVEDRAYNPPLMDLIDELCRIEESEDEKIDLGGDPVESN